MPAPGDQYTGGNVKNPFEERVVSGFTASEIATLQSRLNKQLGPEYISQRPGNGGGKVAYLEGNKAIALANEVFGFNGWSSSLGQVQIDYVDELQNGKVSLGLSIVVRITLKDGTYHEDIGYGSIENGKGKAASFEKAKKEAATDGLKRALRTFGNVLGNCLYDKQYLKKVQSMNVKPIKFQEDNLYRHVDFAPPPAAAAPEDQTIVKRETQKTPARPNQILRTRTDHLNESFSADFDDEADENLFDGVDVAQDNGGEASSDSLSAPDTVAPRAITAAKSNGVPLGRTSPIRNTGTHRQPPQRPPLPQAGRGQPAPQHQNQGPARSAQAGQNQRHPQTPVQQKQHGPGQGRGQLAPPVGETAVPSRGTAQHPPHNQPLRPTPPQAQQVPHQNRPAPPAQGPNTPAANPTTNSNRAPVGFATARAAELLQKADTLPTHIPAFNPNVESPIPKEQRTPGFDSTRSAPIKREAVGVAPAPAPPPGPPAGANAARQGPGANGSGNTSFNRANVVNPHLDVNRRIGAPAYTMSPSANRGAYKPPTFANAAPGQGIKRPALQDVSNQTSGANGNGSGVADGPEPKKQRIEAAQGDVENLSLAVAAGTGTLSAPLVRDS
ncbi:hypothetical protein J1614_004145 [Plenodomus biglobosus]|nr:hypothetical protein J1614_004145 [Plenodomus biglobosus]